VVGFAAGMPAINQWREFVEVGDFMSFDPNININIDVAYGGIPASLLTQAEFVPTAK
jgi:hypothetical protein